jgi:hypothetical protein
MERRWWNIFFPFFVWFPSFSLFFRSCLCLFFLLDLFFCFCFAAGKCLHILLNPSLLSITFSTLLFSCCKNKIFSLSGRRWELKQWSGTQKIWEINIDRQWTIFYMQVTKRNRRTFFVLTEKKKRKEGNTFSQKLFFMSLASTGISIK